MAEYYTDAQYNFYVRMWLEEITRLGGLMADAKAKIAMGQMLQGIYNIQAEDKERAEAFNQEIQPKVKLHDDFYEAVIILMEVKIQAFKQAINRQKDENMLDQINEAMDDWLQKAWLYFGQAQIKQQSEEAKLEFQMFKVVMGRTPTKPKKPTRRGGKKHKKKNK
tara:strand:- start:2256 stop:2750 length:495 start_codon:yes stop_codon:yes gene_type:complete